MIEHECLNNHYVVHFGVKGVKWGIRKYQNYDGTLTAAGRKRYGEETKVLEKELKSTRKEYRNTKKESNKAMKVYEKQALKNLKSDPDFFEKNVDKALSYYGAKRDGSFGKSLIERYKKDPKEFASDLAAQLHEDAKFNDRLEDIRIKVFDLKDKIANVVISDLEKSGKSYIDAGKAAYETGKSLDFGRNISKTATPFKALQAWQKESKKHKSYD